MLQTNLLRKDLQKLDRQIGGNCLIHGTKHYKDNQAQSLKHHLMLTVYLACVQNVRFP